LSRSVDNKERVRLGAAIIQKLANEGAKSSKDAVLNSQGMAWLSLAKSRHYSDKQISELTDTSIHGLSLLAEFLSENSDDEFSNSDSDEDSNLNNGTNNNFYDADYEESLS